MTADQERMRKTWRPSVIAFAAMRTSDPIATVRKAIILATIAYRYGANASEAEAAAFRDDLLARTLEWFVPRTAALGDGDAA